MLPTLININQYCGCRLFALFAEDSRAAERRVRALPLRHGGVDEADSGRDEDATRPATAREPAPAGGEGPAGRHAGQDEGRTQPDTVAGTVLQPLRERQP